MHPEDTNGLEHLAGSESMLDAASTRRVFLLGSLVFLAGCSTAGSSKDDLPGVIWSDDLPRSTRQSGPPRTSSAVPRGVIRRSTWARGNPIPGNMNPMQPVRRITIHHDGMEGFTSTSRDAAAAHLERIRRGHLSRGPQRWGDIGYHYAIDPAGRVWECRPLQWQGAHVKDQNPGNLGILVMGNYDKQELTIVQQQAVDRFVTVSMQRFNVSPRNLHTHQELAPTACPGRSLQSWMVRARSNNTFS